MTKSLLLQRKLSTLIKKRLKEFFIILYQKDQKYQKSFKNSPNKKLLKSIIK